MEALDEALALVADHAESG